MAKITNTGKAPRAIPLKSGKYVFIAREETADFPDDDLAAVIDRASIKADIDNGVLKIEGYKAPAPKAPKVKAAKEVVSLATGEPVALPTMIEG